MKQTFGLGEMIAGVMRLELGDVVVGGL